MGEEILVQEEGVSKKRIYFAVFIILIVVVLLIVAVIFLLMKFSSNDLPPLGATEQEHIDSLSPEDRNELENPVLPSVDAETSDSEEVSSSLLLPDLPLNAEGEFEE
ncbi:hypothetical protein HOA56_00185 [archaeon]|jgi:hypothetical protein|nr:hypothetical protein [Candidatus Woesearchaeota archaeon]MBT6820819.1 hypothetical protein [archaeon]MBT7706013.1 hypothetical protein [archaeon]